jgi:hypothetical protein
MEEICERENLKQALKRVKSNKGAPGVDGMTVCRVCLLACLLRTFRAVGAGQGNRHAQADDLFVAAGIR